VLAIGIVSMTRSSLSKMWNEISRLFDAIEATKKAMNSERPGDCGRAGALRVLSDGVCQRITGQFYDNSR